MNISTLVILTLDIPLFSWSRKSYPKYNTIALKTNNLNYFYLFQTPQEAVKLRAKKVNEPSPAINLINHKGLLIIGQSLITTRGKLITGSPIFDLLFQLVFFYLLDCLIN
jgi:hypothetical protein